MAEIFFRYLHFAGIIVLASALVAEHLLIDKKMALSAFRRLAIIDRVYGLAALLTLIAGLILWLGVGKPKEFYSGNFIFHIKMAMFVLIGAISLVPTVFYIKHRNTTSQDILIPSYITNLIRLQMAALLIMPLLAVLVARGIGFQG